MSVTELSRRPTGVTVTPVTISTTSQVVAAENPLRRHLVLMNDSGSVVYVKFGLGATTSNFTARIPANTYYEIPVNAFSGDVSAVRASGTSSLIVTETFVEPTVDH